jgi:hypothetical protein
MMMINPPPPSAINLPASMTSSTGAGGVGRSSASGLGIGQQPQPMQVEQMWKIVGEGMSVDAVDKKRVRIFWIKINT